MWWESPVTYYVLAVRQILVRENKLTAFFGDCSCHQLVAQLNICDNPDLSLYGLK